MFEIDYKRLSRGERLKGIRLVQISDLHIAKSNLRLLNNVKESINSLKADIIIITGDLICNGGAYINELCHILKSIDARIGKYACMGNHDYADGYEGEKIQKLLKKSDFFLLKNSRKDFLYNNHMLGFCGLDDSSRGFIRYNSVQEGDIVLSHNPITFLELQKYHPNIVFSGHTHGGQLFLESMKNFYYSYLGCTFLSGFYKSSKSLLYVNRGLGNVVFKPKLFGKEFCIHTPRINANAEVTVFEFE